MHSDPSSTTRVLYLAGWGRSGSTLAERLLDQVPGLVGVGEIKFLWERGLLQNRRCSCGTPLRSCEFWVDVLGETFGGLPDDATARALDAASRRFRTRHLPGLLLKPASPPDADAMLWYYQTLERLYRAVARVSGAEVVVDSSKFPSYLTALLQGPALDVRVAHIVRDPRAVAYSWQRHRADPDAPGDAQMPRMHPGATALYWSAWNLATERIATRTDRPYLRFRYEDLIADPAGTLAAITKLSGVPAAALPLGDRGEVFVPRTHQVSGNPMRFHTGPVALRLDDEWTTGMATRHRYLTGAVTVPLRHRYGYH
ncbi:sulfotransferase [Dactylosporangium matsuzakiense]|uniref:Sulfotransferase family protein n=1 Tax=Dactylosporangium matsuzakiense TaxID=53360 RepID=A0A9W6KPD0_9ACTN|nr:sulfotransferase [Dactylosporangium matsuzakiense]UWZ42652.1 sulfotransferase [Dactylosporangium matsuzakiense]GLL03875.1 sulfotransferase family protein [Dactylosporangium matsuzakiense]